MNKWNFIAVMAIAYQLIFLLILLLAPASQSMANSSAPDFINLEEHTSILFTQTESLSVEQANSSEFLFRYSPWQKQSFYFSKKSGMAWLRVKIPSEARLPALPILKLIPQVGITPEVYFYKNNNYQKLEGVIRTNVVLYSLLGHSLTDSLIMIRVPASATDNLLLMLRSPQQLLDQQDQFDWQMGWLLALFLMVSFWNIINWLKHRHPIYLIFASLGLIGPIFLSSWQGLIQISIGKEGWLPQLLMSVCILTASSLLALGARILLTGKNKQQKIGFSVLACAPTVILALILTGINFPLENSLIVFLIISQITWYCSLLALNSQYTRVPFWITSPFNIVSLLVSLTILGFIDFDSITAIWLILHTAVMTLIAFSWQYNNQPPEQYFTPPTPAVEAEAEAEPTVIDHSIFDAMGHELRTPLNGVLGMSELMMSTQLTPRQENYLQTIRYAGGELGNLINLLSEAWKMGANETNFSSAPYDVCELLNSSLDKFRYRTEQLNTELISFIHPNVPVNSKGDTRLISLILEAILSQSLAQVENSEVMVSLNHTSLLPNASSTSNLDIENSGYLLFQISFSNSNNNNLSAINIDTIDTYSEAKKVADISLPLFIAIKLAHSMGAHVGFMGVDNIHIWFAVPHSPLSNNQTVHEQAPSFTEHSIKALIVDDNRTCRQVLMQQCSLMGIQTMDAEDGRSALAMIRNESYLGRPFDVIILDHHMPGMNGIQMVEKLHDNKPENFPDIIMLTGATNPPGKQRAERLGIKQFLTKPANRSTLEKALMTAVKKTEIEKEKA
ncbi:hypothetical protein EOPP23_03920 [Endozoicomonas sp. OPT23]|uniref:response regulator n=1 Tax=Endozoicomonas sp. OPT23 TaxID=2072845 RepID=UPI00129A174B|nr:response regulator [Endozoicomonas sp. OPT23]MRI32142.1 hypothetical protein [Endozoicomonas sp. OPT23]